MIEYLVIGAGVSGVTTARLLQLKGIDDVLILEADSEPGGLCRTRVVDGHVLDIGGGHFLCTRFPEVYEFIFSHIPRAEFNFFERVSKIRLPGALIDYPIESNLWQLPLDEQVAYLASIARSGEQRGDAAPVNYEQWVRWKLGDRIADHYLLPYNQKIWGVEPHEMDIDWLHKIPRFDLEEMIRASLSRTSDNAKMPSHAGFFYPKSGGFQTIFNAIAAPVQSKIVLNEPVRSVARRHDRWLVNGRYAARSVINTAPWPDLFDALGRPESLVRAMARLRHNTLVVSLFDEEFDHDWHWLYDPGLDIPHHREFFISNFAPHSRRGGVFRETNFARWSAPQSGAVSRPLYEHVNRAAYPIPVIGHAQAIREVLRYFEPMRLYGVGRWGQWQYFNSDVCIREAMNLVAKITRAEGTNG